jgi:hypothetical protein
VKANPVAEIDAFLNSDASVSSTKTSTVNLFKFVDEIEKVDRMYFGNIVLEINLRDDIS